MALRVDVVSDVVCPWCVIGYLRLEHVIDTLSLSQLVEIHWHPFELNPAMSQQGVDLYQHMFDKHTITKQMSDRARQSMTKLGKELDFEFNYQSDLKIYNTRKAHQLLIWSAQFGLQYSLSMALFNAYFNQRADINCPNQLCNIAHSVGLNPEVARQVINDRSWHETVANTEQQWVEAGISAVPTFIFNQNQVLVGAQSGTSMIDMITKVKG